MRNTNNKCRQIRAWLYRAVSTRFGLNANWIQNHIADCPRCQRRLASVGLVNLALSIIKSEPHRLNLLMRANAQAISTLKHSLRQGPKAKKLKAVRPEPKPLERLRKYHHSAANTAACIAILLLMKAGVFSSMDKFQSEGRKAVKNYYAANVGQDLANELFNC